MQIHELKSIKKRVQRIGRSGKRGSYSGRGVKGQKSRSGRRMRPAERDLIMRIPKKRGFRNLPKAERPVVFNVGMLSTALKSFVKGKDPLELDLTVLKASGLLRKSFNGSVKLLGEGEMAFPVVVNSEKGIMVSASARTKIEKAGGRLATSAQAK